MISMMSATTDGGVDSPLDRRNGAVGEEPAFASTSSVGSDDNANDFKRENEGARLSDANRGENQPTSSVLTMHGNRKKSSSRNGYRIGDMVWGKVKSHPWWPGHIYNEAFASPSVRRSKHERSQVLVAFFGDSSYGWFEPAELIPFEENFAEKSRQTTSRTFLTAVEEAVDELSRRRSLGLACRCRNEFNFWPANVEGYFVVDVGDYEPGVYSSSQIGRGRGSFRPREMLAFVHQLALEPMDDHQWDINFIKNKATVLACRKALFEEFDDTYAEAFGTVPVRPPHPTAPVTLDPSKAPLSGRLVIAETLGKGKISVKPAKTKDQVEKDKYLFKRRDESIHMKSSKKASSGRAGHSGHPLLVDGSTKRYHMQQASDSAITDGQHQPRNNQASISSDIKSSEASRRLAEGGPKKAKVLKRPAEELNAENAVVVEKRKKKKKKMKNNAISIETGGNVTQLPAAVSSTVAGVDNIVSVLTNQKKDEILVSSSSSQSQQEVDFARVELQMLVTDLRALALNPFHGEERSCPAVIRQVFLQYRSLVYQKSLVLPLPAENVASEGNSNRLPADKSNDKIVKPSVVRLDDPTKGGKKRGPSDHPEGVKKKKKLDGVEEVKKRKVDDSWDTKKKKADVPKLQTVERKTLERSTESQRHDLKDASAAKKVLPIPAKAAKVESSKRTEKPTREVNPTMLVMKFPAGAALPSGPELRAKFARFGPLDHSATRIFWKSYTCRLVYLYKTDAEVALKFADGSSNLFGNASVRCHLKEIEVEASDPEPVKLPKEDVSVGASSQSRDSAADQRRAPKIVGQTRQHPQLKSILKKPSGDEGGNGSGRGARVKFVLGGGDESIKGELLFNENKNTNIGVHSKILPKSNPQLAPPSSTQLQKIPLNVHSSEQGTRPFNAPTAPQMPGAPAPAPAPVSDISEEMLNLLTRCKDVVNNVTSVLGYMPYHPL